MNRLDLKCKNLSRISSENYSPSRGNERFTDTIIEVEEMYWSSCSLGRCGLIVNVGFLLAEN